LIQIKNVPSRQAVLSHPGDTSASGAPRAGPVARKAMTDALLTFCFFTLGIAVLASGYRAMTALLPNPVYVFPNRVAAPLLTVLWALVALGFVAWYVIDSELPAP
jgi:hypothetical protein